MTTINSSEIRIVSGDLQIPSPYETYKVNRMVINALIKVNPTSDFAAGSVTEVAIAASMAFGAWIQGGTWYNTLGSGGLQKILMGEGCDDTYTSNSGNRRVTMLNGSRP